MQRRSPQVHAATLLDALLLTRNGPKVLPGGGPPGTHVVHGDPSFDYHDADFVLFGVTAEEIRWLQRDSSSSSTTPKPPSTGETRTSFTNSPVWCTVSEVCAPVVLWDSTDSCRLWTHAQEGLGMFLGVRGTTCASPPNSSTWTRPRLPRVRPPPPLPFR